MKWSQMTDFEWSLGVRQSDSGTIWTVDLTLTWKISLKIKCSILNSIFDYLRYQMIESVIPWNKIKENVIFLNRRF